MKPPTWAEATAPTAAEFLDWFLDHGHADRIEILEEGFAQATLGRRCFAENHEGRIGELTRYAADLRARVTVLEAEREVGR